MSVKPIADVQPVRDLVEGQGVCPFCGEDGFDPWGLKLHLLMFWCPNIEYITAHDNGFARPDTEEVER